MTVEVVELIKELVRIGLFWLVGVAFTVGVAIGLLLAAAFFWLMDWLEERKEKRGLGD